MSVQVLCQFFNWVICVLGAIELYEFFYREFQANNTPRSRGALRGDCKFVSCSWGICPEPQPIKREAWEQQGILGICLIPDGHPRQKGTSATRRSLARPPSIPSSPAAFTPPPHPAPLLGKKGKKIISPKEPAFL